MGEAVAYVAGGTILAGSFVKLDPTANHIVLQCGAGEAVFGVAQQGGNQVPIPSVTDNPPIAAVAGQQLRVYQDGEYCQVRVGTGGITPGFVRSGANGTAVAMAGTAGTVENYGAIAIESAAAGTMARVMVKIGTRTNPAA